METDARAAQRHSARPGPAADGDLRVAAVIPALNEAAAIARVVDGLRSQRAVLLDAIVVVDNGSTDGTGDVARRAGAVVVREERRGYGSACYAGVLAAGGADVVVLMDGDAADDPRDLPSVVGPVLRDEADLVVGSRALGSAEPGAMTTQQVFGNRLAAWLIGRLYSLAVSDLGPLRAIRRSALLALDMREMTYGWSVEMVVKAARAGYRYREVPVRYRRRAGGVSKVGGTLRGSVRAGCCIVATAVRYARWAPRPSAAAPSARPR